MPALATLLPSRSTLVLLRFPFSLLLLPVFLFAWGQSPQAPPETALQLLLLLHLLVYPASNGYNSYVDRDTDSIGGIERPPLPQRQLFGYTLGMDLLSAGWALLLGWKTLLLVAGYVLASRAYSAPWPRLKRYPLLSWAVVSIFQGGYIFWLCQRILGGGPAWAPQGLAAAMACSLLIGGMYPLTQIYQHEADAARGDLTLSRLLGKRGTFICSGLCFAAATALLAAYFLPHAPHALFTFLACMSAPATYMAHWARQVWADPSAADFSRCMRMNLLSALCLNGCFLLLLR